MSDLVSIIMPAYNAATYISKTIESIIAQTYRNWELLIVDDCSSDNTAEVIVGFGDERIRYLKNEKNSGAAISRNYALREAKGRWIAFLDADDLWEPNKLERQLEFMINNDYKFTFTDYKIVDSKGDTLPWRFTAPNRIGKRQIYRYCYFSTITVIYEREALGLLQIADIRKNNDYALWLKALEKVDAYRFPEVLSIVCKRENSISSGSKFKLIKWHYILFRQALNKGVCASIYLTLGNLLWGVHRKIYYKEPL